jgi:uncharacterized protein
MTDLVRGVWPSPIDDPYADERTQPFWDAAAAGHLVGYRCSTCSTFVMPPQPRCFSCQHTDFEWVDLPGTGTIYSFTVVRHPLAAYLAPVTPYVAAVIDIDGTQGAGARMLANVVDAEVDAVRIGDRVRAVFDNVSDTLTVVRFTPVTAG